MKWIKYKKTAVIFFLLVFSLSAIGWGKKSVDLLKKDLLDLDKAIDAANWGIEDNPQAADESNTETEDNSSVSKNNSFGETIKVRINGERIFVDGEETGKGELEKKIKTNYSGREKVRLFDDYAEAHIYKEVNGILTGLSNSMGFEYDEGN